MHHRLQFVSYPKSGRSWIRYMFAQLEFDHLIKFHHDGFEFNDGTCPPHNFELDPRIQMYSGVEKLVYLERHPCDVMVSLYHQVTGRFRDFFGYTDSVSAFIRDPYFGAQNLRKFRLMWQSITEELGFLTISYESCHADTRRVLERLVDYYGFDVNVNAVERAVECGRFDKMKVVEQSGQFEKPWLQLRNAAPKVRKGKVGGFREELGQEDIEYLESIFPEIVDQGRKA